MYHLYEIVLQSPQMWLKLQASCDSQEQATAVLEHHFGGHAPHLAARPYLVNVTFSFQVPKKLSECSDSIFNWSDIKDRLLSGWDQQEFCLVEGPYPWCEMLTDDCDCHGMKGRLDSICCSDFGLNVESAKRVRKSPNTRHSEYLKGMRRRLVDSQQTSRATRQEAGVRTETPEQQEGLYCQVDGRFHAYSEEVKQKVAVHLAANEIAAATWSEEQRRAWRSHTRAITAHLFRTFQFQECADRLAAGKSGVPDVLYKYIPKKRIGEGAPNSLRATHILALNDDMECNITTMNDTDMDVLDFLSLVQSRLKECLGAEVSEEELLLRSLRYGDLRLSTFLQEYLHAHVGVVSLCTDVLVPTMWAHYARNTGIVVGYDTEALRERGYELRQMSYSELAPTYTPASGDAIHQSFPDREWIERDTRSDRYTEGTPILGRTELAQLDAEWRTLSRVLFVKGTSWEYEKEVRLLVDLQQARDTGKMDINGYSIKVIDVPPEAIKEIYGGAHTSEADVARAIRLARGDNKSGLFVGHVSSHAFRIHKTGGMRH